MAKQTEQKRILVHVDQSGINNFTDRVNTGRTLQQAIADTFPALGFEYIHSQLHKLLEDPQAYINAKRLDAIEGTPTIAGIEVSKEKLLELLPALDTSALIHAVNAFKSFIGYPHINLDLPLYEVKEGKVIVDQDRLNQHIEGFKTYATTPDEIETAEAYLGYVKAYRTLQDVMDSRGRGSLHQLNINMYLSQDQEGKWTFNPYFYNSLT